ncbi:hypothetical protein HBI49_098990 [Parastagonospora nodorum]|nr:hypothetical protein HBI95_104160 [Parastagonospora nodorum]KAH4605343.1 hypothetical protein HBH82_122260 [Parastagonospora nodorum]KAH4710305.1 hypothetical protein HBH67_042510 [Parastagonospora nodorum]KAH4734961.1 hypothetical protein HBH78_001990 [Parastagonospora nodorum]KAH4783570.1 hypothetical protein HBH62_099460 [Parastagonospora nodorum]
MPRTRNRTENAQGRQKSCSECAKGKRKCDLGNPSCRRCVKQRLTCSYPQPRGQVVQSTSISDESAYGRNEYGVPSVPIDADVEHASAPVDFDLPTDTDIAEFDFGTAVASLESLSDMLYTSPNDQSLALNRVVHHQTQTFSVSCLSPFAKSRVEWPIEQLKLAPRAMVEQNGTPWQHAMLYQEHMPQVLQDACAACALYIAKNTINNDFIASFIKRHVEAIISSPIPEQPIDLLARAHALMLYQSMLVFGGDISLYSQAESSLSCMNEVAYALHSLTDYQEDPTGSIPLYPSAVARASWTAYIFRESLRRTVLALFHFVTMCQLMRGQLKSCNEDRALGYKMTISAQLWSAKSAFDYAVTWNNQRHFIVKELDFSGVLRDAMPEDIDTLGKMMMICLKGEDDIRGWFYTRGGVL